MMSKLVKCEECGFEFDAERRIAPYSEKGPKKEWPNKCELCIMLETIRKLSVRTRELVQDAVKLAKSRGMTNEAVLRSSCGLPPKTSSN